MISQTKGIVLRKVKYGETSLVVTMFTELFGVQSYLVNGVRTVSKKGSNKAVHFQPAALLELEAYHNEFKNLQRLKEYKWQVVYDHIFSDVSKNAVALFMIELLTKCLKQPEAHPELFYFVEDALQHLDRSAENVAANFPLFFALHLPNFFGFRIHNSFSEARHYLDLHEGTFTADQPNHSCYLVDGEAAAASEILRIMQPAELQEVVLNVTMRRRMMSAIEQYYGFHIPDFGSMKTLPVLKEILS